MTPEEVRAKFGRPPSPTIVVSNPASEKWVERVSIWLCVDAHEADAIPCADHRQQARQVRNLLAPGFAVRKEPPPA